MNLKLPITCVKTRIPSTPQGTRQCVILPSTDFKVLRRAFSLTSHKYEPECSGSKLFRNAVIVPHARTVPHYDQGCHSGAVCCACFISVLTEYKFVIWN